MIRGFFDPWYRPPLPIVVAGLVLPHRSSAFAPIEFVLDTGASATCLHPTDARQRLRYTNEEFADLPRIARESHALAGITGQADYFTVPARYIFADDDGGPQVINAQIRIAQPSSGNQALPSVLGWDILEHFRIVLDRRTGEVLLH